MMELHLMSVMEVEQPVVEQVVDGEPGRGSTPWMSSCSTS